MTTEKAPFLPLTVEVTSEGVVWRAQLDLFAHVVVERPGNRFAFAFGEYFPEKAAPADAFVPRAGSPAGTFGFVPAKALRALHLALSKRVAKRTAELRDVWVAGCRASLESETRLDLFSFEADLARRDAQRKLADHLRRLRPYAPPPSREPDPPAEAPALEVGGRALDAAPTVLLLGPKPPAETLPLFPEAR